MRPLRNKDLGGIEAAIHLPVHRNRQVHYFLAVQMHHSPHLGAGLKSLLPCSVQDVLAVHGKIMHGLNVQVEALAHRLRNVAHTQQLFGLPGGHRCLRDPFRRLQILLRQYRR